jgi:fatty acid synthase subunit beta
MASTPIHEITEGRNTRVKQFYWKLWFGDDQELPDIDVHETFTGPEITIEAETIERFCAVIGNDDGSFKSARNSNVKAPMDFAIVTGWQVGAL